MQTFLTHPLDFNQCARTLDNKRLGKQRVEAFQILNALVDPEYGWQSHPAVEMWRGYEQALMIYHDKMIDEWVRRGFRNTMKKFRVSRAEMPPWLNVELLWTTHRGNLMRKDESYYGKFNWNVPKLQCYWWPYNRVNGQWQRNF